MLISLSEPAQLIMMTSWASLPFSARCRLVKLRHRLVDFCGCAQMLGCWNTYAMSFSASIKSRAFIYFLLEAEISFRFGVTPFWVSLSSFALVRFSRYQNFEVCKWLSFYLIGELLNNFWWKRVIIVWK